MRRTVGIHLRIPQPVFVDGWFLKLDTSGSFFEQIFSLLSFHTPWNDLWHTYMDAYSPSVCSVLSIPKFSSGPGSVCQRHCTTSICNKCQSRTIAGWWNAADGFQLGLRDVIRHWQIAFPTNYRNRHLVSTHTEWVLWRCTSLFRDCS